MSFKKNIAEYKLFAKQLSSEKIPDQFFVWSHTYRENYR